MKKFILAENIKHILNEKYLLNERYILTEASWEQVAQSWTQKIQQEIPQVKDIVNSFKKNTDVSNNNKQLEPLFNDIEKAGAEVDRTKHMPGATEEMKKDLASYYNAVVALYDQVLKPIGGDAIHGQNGIYGNLDELKTLLSTTAWTEDVQNQAIKIYDNIAALIKKLITNATIPQPKGKTTTAVDDFNADCDKCIKLLDELDSKYLISTNVPNDQILELYTDTLKNKIQPAFEAIINQGAVTSQIKNLNTYSKLLDNLITAIESFADEDFTKGYSSEKKDWNALYKACNTDADFKAFWAKYFSTEWKDKGDIVQSFGLAFIQDVKELGFDDVNNPLIKFLEIIREWIGTIFTAKSYVTIHNAVARGWLKGSDLKASATSKFGKSNIIFNPNLYSAQDINEYLKCQYTLDSRSSSLKGNLQNIYSTTGGRIQILNNLMLVNGDTINFSKQIAAGGKLKPITEVKQTLEQITGKGFDDKNDATGQDVTNVIKRVTSAPMAKRLLAYLVEVLKFVNIEALNRANKNLSRDLNAANILFTNHDSQQIIKMDEANNFDKILNLDTFNYKTDQWITILTELAKIAKLP